MTEYLSNWKFIIGPDGHASAINIEKENQDIEIPEFIYSGMSKSIKTEKSILNELENFRFNSDIKYEANDVYKKLKINIKRGKNRIMLYFFVLYNAHLNLNKTIDPFVIADEVGLNRNHIERAFTTFSYNKTGYRMKTVNTSPIQFIPEYYNYSGLITSELDNVLNLANSILSKPSILSEKLPQEVAAAIIMYYMKLNSMIYSDYFIQCTRHSEAALKILVDIVATVDNS